MAVLENFGVEHTCAGQVGQQNAESDGQEQQRLEALSDGKIHQNKGNDDHNDGAPVSLADELHDAGLVEEVLQSFAVGLRALIFGGGHNGGSGIRRCFLGACPEDKARAHEAAQHDQCNQRPMQILIFLEHGNSP